MPHCASAQLDYPGWKIKTAFFIARNLVLPFKKRASERKALTEKRQKCRPENGDGADGRAGANIGGRMNDHRKGDIPQSNEGEPASQPGMRGVGLDRHQRAIHEKTTFRCCKVEIRPASLPTSHGITLFLEGVREASAPISLSVAVPQHCSSLRRWAFSLPPSLPPNGKDPRKGPLTIRRFCCCCCRGFYIVQLVSRSRTFILTNAMQFLAKLTYSCYPHRRWSARIRRRFGNGYEFLCRIKRSRRSPYFKGKHNERSPDSSCERKR